MRHTTPHPTQRPAPHPTTGTSHGDGFVCAWCGLTAPAVAPARHHCPSCLHARHTSGGCHGRMVPISIAVLPTGDWTVIHRCVRCDALTSRPVGRDDNRLVLMRMAVRPLAQPPFPLEPFGSL
ncbi:RNHCP domain-containing protein [Streptomyces sp. SID5785]|uniref:RNHCP domain-containing protein n=1 Tax=Streptomyces sp. SID5785 TaxID=2690309 RepID=UPI00136134F8|nr:RNHCP domain-containing protein [Streptomyces sp. SID5785]MZD08445.1 RNHCP domain-containing protein [Streptomyces sp. SID5785]